MLASGLYWRETPGPGGERRLGGENFRMLFPVLAAEDVVRAPTARTRRAEFRAVTARPFLENGPP
jgi:hypothetical protein